MIAGEEVRLRRTDTFDRWDQAANLFKVLAWSLPLKSVLRTAHIFDVSSGHQWFLILNPIRLVEMQNLASPVVRCHHILPLRRKILDKFGGTSTIDASIMVFGLHKFCVSTCPTFLWWISKKIVFFLKLFGGLVCL